MPRQPRQEGADAIHHVFARGNRAAAIFLDDEDRHAYLRLLGTTIRRHEWRCLVYCLMTNHVHLLIETPAANLGAGVHLLHGEYAMHFNERHGTVGHLFQSRYGAKRIEDEVHLITVARYLEANPVEAGLVTRPEDWPWSSRGTPVAPPWLAADRLRELLGL